MPSSMGPRGTTIGAVLNAHKNVEPVLTAADLVPLSAEEWLRKMSASRGLGIAPSTRLPPAPVPVDVLSWLQNMARAGGLGIAPSTALRPVGAAGLGPLTFQSKH